MSDELQREPDQLDGVALPEFAARTLGHLAARATFDGMLAEAKMPGAVLLHGPRGIGKATLAFSWARQLFLLPGEETENQVRQQIASGGHPNLRVLRREPRDTGKGFHSFIRVEDVRAMTDRLHKTRGRAGHRVVVVDAIDDCNGPAANALLKILEEPPSETLFLLISHRPGSLLPTIKSRSQAIALRPLAGSDIANILRSAGVETSRIAHAVELAEGRPRRGFEALALSDDGILATLKAWLKHPATANGKVHLGLADALGADKAGAEMAFARDMLRDWLAAEAKAAAAAGPSGRRRLASANGLWEKANLLFADADSLNLDARQTLTVLFDTIRKHGAQHLSQTEPT